MFVTLLWYTGHRAASVRELRWSDVDLEARTVEWRAGVDKIGYQHKNPLHAEAVDVLSRGKVLADETGDVWIFQHSEKSTEPMTRNAACKLCRQIAGAAGIKAGSRLGTHAFRRSFAGRLRDVPISELKELGGWKTEKTVIDTIGRFTNPLRPTKLGRSWMGGRVV
jgi:integrase